MNKELAQKIFGLSLQQEKIDQEKWDIKKELGAMTWEEVMMQMAKFMMEVK